ncbi:alpha/beta-Hydrolase [Apiospora rasikravindrae]|uniref:Alpha/beta-Hydrolase n=1 Tax=Apiospora rasikravindrae TaxID=990691 RepID=A0ABR1UA56_9PEZI
MESPEYLLKTRGLPRILCLHGGGTNAVIFRAQCRQLSLKLEPYFRLVYAEAPYASKPGPDVVSVYADYGPFKRWLRWLPEHPEVEERAAREAIDASIRQAMDDDDDIASGPWVGLLGFSQGAKLAASLLYRQQIRVDKLGRGSKGTTDFKFAVLMAGRAPIVSLDPDVFHSSMLGDCAEIALKGPPDLMDVVNEEHVLRLPTIHVHGTLDTGLPLHRELLEKYCSPETARVLEWPGGHRIPLKSTDVNPLIDQMLDVARQTGALAP